MKQNLLNFFTGGMLDEVLTKGDAALCVITKTRPAHGSVKTEGVIDESKPLKKLVGQINYFATHRHRLACGQYLLGL